jgi:hypothetical protein
MTAAGCSRSGAAAGWQAKRNACPRRARRRLLWIDPDQTPRGDTAHHPDLDFAAFHGFDP